MTDAQMVEQLEVEVDEIGGIAPFYTTADYYEALNEGQREVFSDLQQKNEYRSYRTLIVPQESVADGATLAHHCVTPYSVYDSANGMNVRLSSWHDYMTYQNSTLPNFKQAYIVDDVLHTTPASATFLVNYLRPPVPISVGVSSELSLAVHPLIVQRAFQILIHKDLDAPAQEYIEAWRNKLAVYRTGKVDPNAAGFFPAQIPYQNR